jgi:nucleotide-binding universal stress UspA family protein
MDLRHILAGADETSAGRDAVACAIALAKRASARVTVLRAVMTTSLPARAGATTTGGWPTSEADASEIVRLQRWLAADVLALDDTPPVSFDVGFGVPGIEICRYAEQGAVDLIVIGRKNRSQTARLLVGDTADAVARRSRLPCLFVPHRDGDIRRLLVALDGTERGMAVLRQACDFARSIGATLRILTVERAPADEPVYLASSVPVARTASLEVKARELVKESGLSLDAFQVSRGEVVSCVLAALEEGGTEALVIGCHRGGPPGILEAGSNSRRLLHTAPCAVMTIPL